MIPKDLKPDHLNIISKNTLVTHLNIEFTDGVEFKYEVNNLIYEICKI